jgi:hypothetical protein
MRTASRCRALQLLCSIRRTLVGTTARGAPATQNTKDDRDIYTLPTYRLALEDAVFADEVQNVRGFGSETELESLGDEVNRRNLRMSRSLQATEEIHRINAIKGTLLDADASTLINLHTRFGVTQQTEVDFDLDNGSPASGALRKVCSSVIRTIEDELGGLPYTEIMAICDSAFFDDLTAHPEYRANKLNFEDARDLSGRIARRRVTFGGITFEEYRGSVGGTAYVAANKAHVFPLGVPDLFITRYAPAEFWDTVNTVGLPRYARQYPDAANPDSKRVLRVQTQMISLCTRPRCVVPAKRT